MVLYATLSTQPHGRNLQIDRIEVFFKQRDDLFFPSWSFVVPTTIMRLPVSFVESLIWTAITYYPVGLAPQASRYALLPFIISVQRSTVGCKVRTPASHHLCLEGAQLDVSYALLSKEAPLDVTNVCHAVLGLSRQQFKWVWHCPDLQPEQAFAFFAVSLGCYVV